MQKLTKSLLQLFLEFEDIAFLSAHNNRKFCMNLLASIDPCANFVLFLKCLSRLPEIVRIQHMKREITHTRINTHTHTHTTPHMPETSETCFAIKYTQQGTNSQMKISSQFQNLEKSPSFSHDNPLEGFSHDNPLVGFSYDNPLVGFSHDNPLGLSFSSDYPVINYFNCCSI